MNAHHRPTGQQSPEDRLDLLLAACGGRTGTAGKEHVCRCPAHDDQNPSLHVCIADDGRLLVMCRAGCSTEAVVEAIGLTLADLFPAGERSAVPAKNVQHQRRGRGWITPEAAASDIAARLGASVAAIHNYPAADGTLNFAVARLGLNDGKTFRPLHLLGDRWQAGDPDGLLPLYRLPELTDTEELLVVEGERCADVARELGIVATTSAHGSKSALKTDWSPVATKRVVIWADADAPGEGYARNVVATLRAANPQIEIRSIRIPGLADGEDIVDWRDGLRASGVADTDIAEQMSVLLEKAEPWSETDCTQFTHSTGGVGVSNSWAAPLPINEQVELPPFPIETAFPASCGQLREYVEAVAHTYQVPVDLPAYLALATFGLAMSRAVEMCPQPGWSEPLSAYVMTLLGSGERKSPVFKVMTGPVYDWQSQVQLSLELKIAAAENDINVLQERLNKARKKAAGDNALHAGTEVQELAQRLKEMEDEKPVAPSLIASEATTEAIADLLLENNERGMLAATEGDALDVLLGRYSSGKPNFGLWLSGHAGDHYEVRRKGREPLRLRRPALTVALAVQPAAILDLMSSAAAEGRGLLARFFFSAPHSIVGFRELEPNPIPTSLSDWYGARLHLLLDRPVQEEPTLLYLSDEARELFREFRARNEADLKPKGRLARARAWGAKLPGAIARIAGILHGIADPDLQSREISGATMAAALTWEPYLIAHQRHVASQAGLDATSTIALKIVEWIRSEGRSEFTRNEAYNGARGAQVKKTKDLDLE